MEINGQTTRRKTKHGAHIQQPLGAADNPDALLNVATVGALCGMGRSTILQAERDGKFPQAVRMGTRCTRWRAGDVTDWLQAQAATRRAA